jgi:hypothetical protein
MKISVVGRVLILLIILIGHSVSSQAMPVFAGSDNFNGGLDSKWAYSFRIEGSGTGNGELTFTNDRLDFSKGAGEGSFFRGWDGIPGPANGVRNGESADNSWVMDLQVTNNATVGSGEFANIGMEVAYNGLNFFALFLSTNEGGAELLLEYTGRQRIATAAIANPEDLLLRILWNSVDEMLSAEFSTNGGSSYSVLSSGFAPSDPGAWGTSPDSGFYFEVFANTNAGGAIGVGDIYADNFKITSVPTPASALLLAIGLLLLGAHGRLCRAYAER